MGVLLVLFILPACGACAADRTEGDWIYSVRDRTARIEKYNPPEDPPEILTVPESLGGYPVTEITGYAFANSRRLEGWKTEEMPGSRVVILPDTIRSIRAGAFGFDETEEIRIGNNEIYETVGGVLFERQTRPLVA